VVGAPGCVGGVVPGAVAVGDNGLPPGVPAPAGGAGGPPWAPGTGSVLAWGSLAGGVAVGAADGAAVGATLAGVAGDIPGLAIGRIAALGGIGALPS